MAPTIDQHIDPIVFSAAATWAHHAIAHEGNRKDMINGLAIAVALGLIFTVFQAYEYQHAAFGFSGNIYAQLLYGDLFPTCHVSLARSSCSSVCYACAVTSAQNNTWALKRRHGTGTLLTLYGCSYSQQFMSGAANRPTCYACKL